MIDVILAPDVYVNASVAPGTPPDRVVQRVLGQHKGESKATDWILARVQSMLESLPQFRHEAVRTQVDLVKSLVKVLPGLDDFAAEAWEKALVAAAKAAGVKRVITDHPDLLKTESAGGIEFISCEAWLVEATLPPPLPA